MCFQGFQGKPSDRLFSVGSKNPAVIFQSERPEKAQKRALDAVNERILALERQGAGNASAEAARRLTLQRAAARSGRSSTFITRSAGSALLDDEDELRRRNLGGL